MRWSVILVLLLAGCAESSTGPDASGPETPLNGGPMHQAQDFPGVNGTTTRDGIYQNECSAISGNGQIMASSSPFSFKVPRNATKFQVVATWTAPHDTLDLSVYSAEGGTGWGGSSPAASEFFVDTFSSRNLSIRIDPPTCRPPASVDHYDNVEVDLAITFS